MLGPATYILSVGRNGQLLEQGLDETEPHQQNPSLALTAKQWNEVEDYAVVHAAWLALCGQDEAWRGRLSLQPDWQYNALDCLRHATEYRITDAQDRVLFARHALEVGTNFHLDALLSPVWERTRAGEYYGGALEELIGDNADRLFIHLHHET